MCVFLPAVSTFLKERCQQASDHAAEAQAIQEQDHPGLQDPGFGSNQHGRGNVNLQR